MIYLNGSIRWLDHCVVKAAAKQTVVSARVHCNNVFWSDHSLDHPLEIVYNLQRVVLKMTKCGNDNNIILKEVKWRTRELSQINKYRDISNAKLKSIDFPVELRLCWDRRI